MSGKEIVLCNFDEETTRAYLDRFESFFKVESDEEEKLEEHDEVTDSEDNDNSQDEVPMTKCNVPV
jgi:hypothetical protein